MVPVISDNQVHCNPKCLAIGNISTQGFIADTLIPANTNTCNKYDSIARSQVALLKVRVSNIEDHSVDNKRSSPIIAP